MKCRISASAGFLLNDVWTFVPEENGSMILATSPVLVYRQSDNFGIPPQIIHNYGKLLIAKRKLGKLW